MVFPDNRFFTAFLIAILIYLSERTMEEFLVESRAHGWPSFRGKWFNEEKKSCLAFVRRFLELNLIINYVLCTLRRRSKLGVCSLFAEWRSGECGRNPSRTQPGTSERKRFDDSFSPSTFFLTFWFHLQPDGKGSRHCINLVCVAGHPAEN
jgi:hypothetical protein